MRKSAKLIDGLVEAAKARGLSAGDLAMKAGLSPANLSRVRKTGRFNADTLERLLAAVDADIRITVTPKQTGHTLSMICKKLNAGRRNALSPDELGRLLTKFRRSRTSDRAYSHLVGVIEEIPLEQLHDLVIDGDATLSSLERIADYVDGEGPTVDWIHDQIAPAHKLA